MLTAYDDGASHLADPDLLDRATELGRVLFTYDDDLLIEAAQRQEQGRLFSGVVYAHPLRVTIGTCVRDLEIVGTAGTPEEMRRQVLFLPL